MIDDNQRLQVRSWRAPAINHTSKEALAVTTEPNSRNRRPQSNDGDFVGVCSGLTVLLAAQGSGRCEPFKQETTQPCRPWTPRALHCREPFQHQQQDRTGGSALIAGDSRRHIIMSPCSNGHINFSAASTTQ